MPEYGIQDGSNLFLLQNFETLSLVIETLTKVTFDIEICPFESVLDLKMQIQEETEIPEVRQRLICGGKELLEDESSLSQYNIQNKSTVHLFLRLIGSANVCAKPSPDGKNIDSTLIQQLQSNGLNNN